MRRFVWILLLGFALASAGCAGGGSGGGATAASKPAASQAPSKGVAPPAGHRMTKVTLNMSPTQVREILGNPTSENTYPTGKMWIPWYFGSDTMRNDWKYKGEGRVVFSQNRYSGNQKVIRIDYDPTEDGH